jgi:Mg2+ and Co2+ transporter CorA
MQQEMEMTMSCEFNTETCKHCSRFTICSLLNAEKHINGLENQVLNLFSSLNQLIQFSSNTGKSIVEIQEKIPDKNDVIEQFNIVFENFEELKKLVIKQNEEIKKLILDYSDEMKNISLKLLELEKIVGLESRKTSNEETN